MLKDLPKPTTFEQGQRLMFGLMMVGSGIFFGLIGLAMTVVFVTLAFKFPGHREQILWIMAAITGACWIGQLAVTISMALGGPVGRFKLSASKEGATFEASDDDEPRSVSDNDGSGAV